MFVLFNSKSSVFCPYISCADSFMITTRMIQWSVVQTPLFYVKMQFLSNLGQACGKFIDLTKTKTRFAFVT